jgi:hypothetical protein
VTFAVMLLVVGGFLLGGAYSIWKADSDTKGRTGPQVAFAVLLLIAAVLATGSGILRLV